MTNLEPGSNISAYLKSVGVDPFAAMPSAMTPEQAAKLDRHGTTIVAVTFGDGVVMAADRRSTAGSSIAQRDVQKLHPADRHSGVAIAGSAGFGIELVRIFQLELEHYEKSEGLALSLEGKANLLGRLVR